MCFNRFILASVSCAQFKYGCFISVALEMADMILNFWSCSCFLFLQAKVSSMDP